MIRRPPRSTLFPYRRSSDLNLLTPDSPDGHFAHVPVSDTEQPGMGAAVGSVVGGALGAAGGLDRKSTRLNSSHLVISYAVFCLTITSALRAHDTSSARCACT